VNYVYGNRSQESVVEPAITPEAPFDVVSRTYDSTFSASEIGRAQRRSVWEAMDRTFQKGQRILEINCGTGIDALHLAGRGVEVVACDSASGMIAVAAASRRIFESISGRRSMSRYGADCDARTGRTV